MALKRRHEANDVAVMIRLEQLSQALDAAPRASSALADKSPSAAEAQRHHAKRERKLLKLHGQVVQEQEATEHLRQSLDQSFREAACRHSSFMQWYHAQHASIDAKYAQQGLRCPWVGAADVERRFRKAASSFQQLSSSSQWSIDQQMDAFDDDDADGMDCGLSPSPLRDDANLNNTNNDISGNVALCASHVALRSPSRGAANARNTFGLDASTALPRHPHRGNCGIHTTVTSGSPSTRRTVTFSDVPHVEYAHGGFACTTVAAGAWNDNEHRALRSLPMAAAVVGPASMLYLGAAPHAAGSAVQRGDAMSVKASVVPPCHVECSPCRLEPQVDHVAIQQELHRELLRQRRTSPERHCSNSL